jgi:hypothetical protein
MVKRIIGRCGAGRGQAIGLGRGHHATGMTLPQFRRLGDGAISGWFSPASCREANIDDLEGPLGIELFENALTLEHKILSPD